VTIIFAKKRKLKFRLAPVVINLDLAVRKSNSSVSCPRLKLMVSLLLFSSFLHRKFMYFNEIKTEFFLKVVGNEKEGGSGRWQMIGICLGQW